MKRKSKVSKAMKIAVTTFYSPNYEPLAALTIPPLQQWCDKHGYFLNINKIEDGSKHHFVKTKDARKLLDEGYNAVLAIENDILITNLCYKFKIENYLELFGDFFICKDVNNYNGGAFIIRNTEWAKAWLDFINMHETDYGDEQNVMEDFCDSDIFKYKIWVVKHPAFNSIPYEYYAPSYGYINWEQYNPRKEKPTHEQGCWEKGDFCAHLPGMTLEKRIEIFKKLKEEIIYG